MVPLFFQTGAMGGIILILVILGAPIVTGISGALLILALAGLFGLAISGGASSRLITKSEQATSTISLLLFPLMFASTAFVPEELIPEWLRVVNTLDPDQLRDRGHSLADGLGVRLEPDRASAAARS